jgi:hypothetical protein
MLTDTYEGRSDDYAFAYSCVRRSLDPGILIFVCEPKDPGILRSNGSKRSTRVIVIDSGYFAYCYRSDIFERVGEACGSFYRPPTMERRLLYRCLYRCSLSFMHRIEVVSFPGSKRSARVIAIDPLTDFSYRLAACERVDKSCGG